jgi:hypothetical protein
VKCQRCLRRAPVVVGRLGVTVHEGQMRCKLEENHGILVLARGYHQTQRNLKKNLSRCRKRPRSRIAREDLVTITIQCNYPAPWMAISSSAIRTVPSWKAQKNCVETRVTTRQSSTWYGALPDSC